MKYKIGDRVLYEHGFEQRTGVITNTFMGFSTDGSVSEVLSRNKLFVEYVHDNGVGSNICTVNSEHWSVTVIHRPWVIKGIKKHELV
jgi:hypothetical protein